MMPEAKVRKQIDEKLTQAGWVIQDMKQLTWARRWVLSPARFPPTPSDSRWYPVKDLRDRALVAAERGLIKDLWDRVAAELGTALFK